MHACMHACIHIQKNKQINASYIYIYVYIHVFIYFSFDSCIDGIVKASPSNARVGGPKPKTQPVQTNLLPKASTRLDRVARA